MSASNNLSFREEIEIGVSIASELIDLVWEGKVSSSEIRSTLREVVEEEGVGHTDDFFVDKVTAIYRSRFGLGRLRKSPVLKHVLDDLPHTGRKELPKLFSPPVSDAH
jgi:hypothetical protein